MPIKIRVRCELFFFVYLKRQRHFDKKTNPIQFTATLFTLEGNQTLGKSQRKRQGMKWTKIFWHTIKKDLTLSQVSSSLFNSRLASHHARALFSLETHKVYRIVRSMTSLKQEFIVVSIWSDNLSPLLLIENHIARNENRLCESFWLRLNEEEREPEYQRNPKQTNPK